MKTRSLVSALFLVLGCSETASSVQPTPAATATSSGGTVTTSSIGQCVRTCNDVHLAMIQAGQHIPQTLIDEWNRNPQCGPHPDSTLPVH